MSDAITRSEAITRKIRGLASEIFDVPVSQITPESSPKTVESWDSVQHLNLILALQEEYGIEFEPEDLEKMQNIGQIVDAVAAKVG